jgi:hypothetical protein
MSTIVESKLCVTNVLKVRITKRVDKSKFLNS